MKRWVLSFTVVLGVLGGALAQGADVTESHAISLLDSVKYPAGFTQFDYVAPDAPKGGTVRLATTSAFDTLNPFTLNGVSADGVGVTYDSLMARSLDESSTLYGLVAETIRVPANNAWVEFDLNPAARWHDGEPITPEDVVFSLNILKTEGNPFYASYYANVTEVEATGERTVRFTFDEPNKELPFIVAELTVLPQHYWEGKDFAATTLEPPLGSGPYRIGNVDAGRSITYERVEDYWAADLPAGIGQNNFDTIRYDVYLDDTVSVEALKSNEFDFRAENSSAVWATGYEVPAVEQGRLVKELIPDENGRGMQAFFYNSRRPKFADPLVREALGYAFDFEWSNNNLFYGQYTRTDSFFVNSELASSGVPEGKELALLEPYRDELPAELFTEPFTLPVTDGSGNLRENLRTASQLLSEADWEIQDGALTSTETGEVMTVEFLLVSPTFERIISPVVQNMQRLGIEASFRTVEAAQYQELVQAFTYDVIVGTISQSQSPGNEQRDYWTSEAADVEGSRNWAGIQNPVVDELVTKVISALDRESLITATHALDRVLLWNHYVTPNWYFPATRAVYWDKFGKPETYPPYGFNFPSTWWFDEEKAAALAN